jgi:hypothetical protein
MSTNTIPGRRLTLALAGLIAVAAATAAIAISGTGDGQASGVYGHHDHAVAAQAHTAAVTAKAQAFHDGMRKLWEDHITWTRMAIVSFAADAPDLKPTEARLLANQVDIGNAVKPFYGNAAGKTLTKLLKEHIIGAVTLMSAAKSGDDAATAKAKADWYVNGNKIADFLHSANPKAWSKATMRSMMKVHLDQTLDEAVNRLNGRFAADIRDYDHVHRHILMMADALSSGIIHQFPKRFR